MALPFYYPFKSRVLNCTVVSSTGVTAAAAPARARCVTILYAFTASQTGAGLIDVTVNGSTVNSLGGLSVTTTTANTSQTIFNAFSAAGATVNSSGAPILLNGGDVIGTSGSSVAVGNVTFVLQEF